MDRGDLQWVGLIVVSLIWVYVAVRMAGRAVLRTLDEYRGKDKKEGQQDEE